MSILPRKGILAVAAMIEIALSAQPMAKKTWRRGKDWLLRIQRPGAGQP
jgi:hypothetical protein